VPLTIRQQIGSAEIQLYYLQFSGLVCASSTVLFASVISRVINTVMMNPNLQQAYERAVASVQNKPVAKLPVKQAPIFQRVKPRDERQAVKDAAKALAALWKMTPQTISR